MRKISLILLFSSSAWAACPLYNYRNDPSMNQEMQNMCQQILNPIANTVTANQVVMNGGLQLKSLTLAQIKAQTVPIGTEYFCSDCGTDSVCVSTSTKTNAFVRLSARTTTCQ
jgi:hypothetical protein